MRRDVIEIRGIHLLRQVRLYTVITDRNRALGSAYSQARMRVMNNPMEGELKQRSTPGSCALRSGLTENSASTAVMDL